MAAQKQKLSMSERAALAAENKKRELPTWWRTGRYVLLLWSVVGGSLYASGAFSSKIYGCTVEIGVFDEFMYTSVMFCGILGLCLVFAGDVFMEK